VHIERSLPLVAILSLLSTLAAGAQVAGEGISTADRSRYLSLLFPVPAGDVLNPNAQRNTPNVKLALRLGGIRASYTNDRYLDNTPLDVGRVEGESSIYTSASSFGWCAGLEMEFPINTGVSWTVEGRYERIGFGGDGPVTQPCGHPGDSGALGVAVHSFDATIDFARLTGGIRLSFPDFYVGAGLGVGIPLASRLVRVRTFPNGDCVFPGTTSSRLEEDGEIPGLAPYHATLRFSVGANYRLTRRLRFSPELAFEYGTTDLNKSPESDLGFLTLVAALRYDLPW